MKKLAIGCLIVIVVAGIAGAIALYYVSRQFTSTLSQVAEVGAVAEIERGVRNQAPYSPPSSGELTAAQVEKLVQVQSQVRTRLGERFTEMERKYKELSEKTEATALDLPQLMAAYRDLAAAWVEGKRVQVDALNATGLSLEEYRWIRSQAYAALGIPVMDVDIARIIEDAKSGRTSSMPGAISGSLGASGPEGNKALVEPHREQLERSAALAALGL
jgi:hypothetical protein